MRIAFLILAALALCMPSEAYELKGFAIGDKKAAIINRTGATDCLEFENPELFSTCTYQVTWVSDRSVEAGFATLRTIAEQATILWKFEFSNDLLGRISVAFHPDRFPAILDAFVEKYGKPTTMKVEQYSNAFNAKTTGRVVSWRAKGESLTLTEYAGSKNIALLEFGSDAHDAKVKAREQGEAKKRGKDL